VNTQNVAKFTNFNQRDLIDDESVMFASKKSFGREKSSELSIFGWGPVAGFFGHRNETSASIKGMKFLDQLNNSKCYYKILSHG
jgi:hypothetical protein